jgi:hypothetical protein
MHDLTGVDGCVLGLMLVYLVQGSAAPPRR